MMSSFLHLLFSLLSCSWHGRAFPMHRVFYPWAGESYLMSREKRAVINSPAGELK